MPYRWPPSSKSSSTRTDARGAARVDHLEVVARTRRAAEGRSQEESGRGEVAGDSGVEGVEALAAGDAEARGCAVGGEGSGEVGSEGAESVLGVIAAADGFGEGGCALGLEAGEEDGGLDLSRGDGTGEVGCPKVAAYDGNGGVAVFKGNARAHAGEWFTNALHRAQGQGVVADKRESAGVRGNQAREHTHGGAGVAAVQRSCGLMKCSARAGNFYVRFFVFDCGAEGRHAGK